MHNTRLRCLTRLLTTLGVFALVGCASAPAPLPTVEHIDLDRFMGDWYVIGLIPNGIEKNAHDSLESYARRPDGKIAITYTFRKGSANGRLKTLDMVGRVVDTETNAQWRVRPFWPLSLEYLVTDLADDYRYTVIAHPSRNYVWIMARQTTASDNDWEKILGQLEDQGFDLERIVRVPHAG